MKSHHKSQRPAHHEKIYIYGKHALTEALLHAPHTVRKVFLSPEVNDPELRALLKKVNLTPGVLKGERWITWSGATLRTRA